MERIISCVVCILFIAIATAEGGSQLVRTIGKPGVFSATVKIEYIDTTKHFVDSICPGYWFVNYLKSYLGGPDRYDFRITIRRQGLEEGKISIYSPEFDIKTAGPDTLACDSLGLGPDSLIGGGNDIDSVAFDSAVFTWSYPRLVKCKAGPETREWRGYSNHLKILLTSKNFRDSIIFTRTYMKWYSNVISPGKNFFQYETGAAVRRDMSGRMIYDIRGRRIRVPETSSQMIVAVMGSAGTAMSPRKIILMGR